MNDMEYLENPYYTLVVWNVDRREWFGAEVCRSSVGYLAMDKGNIACSDYERHRVLQAGELLTDPDGYGMTEFCLGFSDSMTEELSYYNSVWRVIVTEDDQESIDAEIERLNALVVADDPISQAFRRADEARHARQANERRQLELC